MRKLFIILLFLPLTAQAGILEDLSASDPAFAVQLGYFGSMFGVVDTWSTLHVRARCNVCEWNPATEFMAERPVLAIAVKIVALSGLTYGLKELHEVSPFLAHAVAFVLNVGITLVVSNNLSHLR